MDPAARERFLAMLLPTILIGALYITVFNRNAELTAAQADLVATRQSASPPTAVGFERMKLQEARSELDTVKAEQTTLQDRRAELAAVGSPPAALRTQALRQLSAMLWDRGLYPFEEAPLEGESRVAPAFDELMKKLAGSKSQGSNRRLWQIKFYGRYSDVLATLDSLRDSSSPVIPISLTMSETRLETDWRSWTLLLWI